MRTMFLLGCVVILGLLGASQAKASTSYCDFQVGNLVANCGFETDTLSPWTVSGNTTNPGGGFDGEEYGIDAGDADTGDFGFYAGPVGSPMILAQTLTLLTTTSYDISFELEQDTVNPTPGTYTHSFGATFDGITLVTLTNPASAGSFLEYSYVETTGASISSNSISFSFQNDDNYWSFDDVVVVAQTSTPEPASLVLVGGSMAMLGLFIFTQTSKGLHRLGLRNASIWLSSLDEPYSALLIDPSWAPSPPGAIIASIPEANAIADGAVAPTSSTPEPGSLLLLGLGLAGIAIGKRRVVRRGLNRVDKKESIQ